MKQSHLAIGVVVASVAFVVCVRSCTRSSHIAQSPPPQTQGEAPIAPGETATADRAGKQPRVTEPSPGDQPKEVQTIVDYIRDELSLGKPKVISWEGPQAIDEWTSNINHTGFVRVRSLLVRLTYRVLTDEKKPEVKAEVFRIEGGKVTEKLGQDFGYKLAEFCDEVRTIDEDAIKRRVHESVEEPKALAPPTEERTIVEEYLRDTLPGGKFKVILWEGPNRVQAWEGTNVAIWKYYFTVARLKYRFQNNSGGIEDRDSLFYFKDGKVLSEGVFGFKSLTRACQVFTEMSTEDILKAINDKKGRAAVNPRPSHSR